MLNESTIPISSQSIQSIQIKFQFKAIHNYLIHKSILSTCLVQELQIPNLTITMNNYTKLQKITIQNGIILMIFQDKWSRLTIINHVDSDYVQDNYECQYYKLVNTRSCSFFEERGECNRQCCYLWRLYYIIVLCYKVELPYPVVRTYQDCSISLILQNSDSRSVWRIT